MFFICDLYSNSYYIVFFYYALVILTYKCHAQKKAN